MKPRLLSLAGSSLLLIAVLAIPVKYGHAAPVLYYDIANAPDNAWSLQPQYVNNSQAYLTASSLHVVDLNGPNASDLEGPGDFLFTWWSWNPDSYGYIEFSVTPQVAMSLA